MCRVYTGANVAVQMEIMYKLLYAGIDVNVKDHAGMFNKQGLVICVCTTSVYLQRKKVILSSNLIAVVFF